MPLQVVVPFGGLSACVAFCRLSEFRMSARRDLRWRIDSHTLLLKMNRKLSPTWTLAILTGLNLFNYLDRYVLSAVLSPLQNELHISDGQAGRIMTAFMIG